MWLPETESWFSARAAGMSLWPQPLLTFSLRHCFIECLASLALDPPALVSQIGKMIIPSHQGPYSLVFNLFLSWGVGGLTASLRLASSLWVQGIFLLQSTK